MKAPQNSAPPSENGPQSARCSGSDLPGGIPSIFLMINSLETGGSERQFVELARSLNPEAFDVHLGCLQSRGPFAQDVGEIEEFPLGGSLVGWQSLRTRLRLARHMRRYEIAVTHAFDFYSNLTLIPAARLARVPVIIGSHRQLGDLMTPAMFRAQAAAFRFCHAVVCNSRAAAERLIEDGLPERRVVVIGNALAPQGFEKTSPALPRKGDSLRVGMIARMNARYKNHHVFLRAAARLERKFPHLEFLLVGDGPLRAELEQQSASLGLGDRVKFVGDRRDIPALLASMDLSVVPSASESLSNVALESMAAAVPVVATAVGGNAELVTAERGQLVRPDDDVGLANALERLLRDAGLRSELGRNARHFAEQHFTREIIRDRYQNLYHELLAKKEWHPGPVATRRARSKGNNRLRVALVAPTLRFVGGQAVQADLLLRYWKNDPEVEARLLPIDPDSPAAFQWVERIPFLRTLLREPLYVMQLLRELRDVEVAHIFSASYWSFLLAPAPAWLIARLRGKKTLINYRSGEARDHLCRFRSARPVLEGADRLVVPSGYLVDVFREFGLKAQIVPNIVDLEQFIFRVRKPIRPHLVCTRGFHPYYCIDVVVRAFAEVQKTFPEARLDLVGKGPLEVQIRSLVAELGLNGVTFMGVASRQRIGSYYDRADIFINASRLDNMPVSIIEAFGAGTPVVTTAPESMRYLVEHERTGLLSEPGDSSALARNVVRLLRDPDLAAGLAWNAYQESQRYRWAAVREQWLEIYRSLMLGKRTEATPAYPEQPPVEAGTSDDSVTLCRKGIESALPDFRS